MPRSLAAPSVLRPLVPLALGVVPFLGHAEQGLSQALEALEGRRSRVGLAPVGRLGAHGSSIARLPRRGWLPGGDGAEPRLPGQAGVGQSPAGGPTENPLDALGVGGLAGVEAEGLFV